MSANVKKAGGLAALMAKANKTKGESSKVKHNEIWFDPTQPRKDIEPEKLNELAESIKAVGLIQSILIEPADQDRLDELRKEFPEEFVDAPDTVKFLIVVGERRWRACGIAGVEDVDVRITTYEPSMKWLVQLAENSSREDMRIYDEIHAVERAKTEFNLKSTEIAEAIGKPNSTISMYLSIMSSELKMPLLDLLEAGSAVRAVGDLAVLAKKNPEFVREKLKTVEPSEVTLGFVKSLKDLLNPKPEIDKEPGAEEEPGTDKTPGTEEEPGTDKTPGTEEEPGTDKAPGTEEEPGTDKAPGTEEEPGTDKAPGAEEEQLDWVGSLSEAAGLEGFVNRSAGEAKVNVLVKAKEDGKTVFGSLKLNVKPNDAGKVPVEFDDGIKMLSLSSVELTVIGFE